MLIGSRYAQRADSVRAFMARHSLSQRELAELIGAHPSSVVRWLSGECRFKRKLYWDRFLDLEAHPERLR